MKLLFGLAEQWSIINEPPSSVKLLQLLWLKHLVKFSWRSYLKAELYIFPPQGPL